MRVTKFGKHNHAMDRAMYQARNRGPAIVTNDDTGWSVLELNIDDSPVDEQVAKMYLQDPWWNAELLASMQRTWGMTPAEGLVTACNPPTYEHFDVAWARARGDYR
jgi:hypothetical protein